MRIIIDGIPTEIGESGSVLAALLKADKHPIGGGCLCCGGDCMHCLATIDGESYVRTCQVEAKAGMRVDRHHFGNQEPPVPYDHFQAAPHAKNVFCDVCVIGAGESGQAAQKEAEAQGKRVIVIDGNLGEEAIAIYLGPLVVANTPDGKLMVHVKEDVIVATGAAEIQPVAPGTELNGVVTARAAEQLSGAGIDLGQIVAIGTAPNCPQVIQAEGRVVRILGNKANKVIGVIIDHDGQEMAYECDTVSFGLGFHPRDALARQGAGMSVRAVGDASKTAVIPPCPLKGIVCACSGVSVDDLQYTWDSGFQEMELIKRSTLAGTGTCQGMGCIPHLRAFIQDRGGDLQDRFTARPVTKQLTIAEVAAGAHFHPQAQTALHHEHIAHGAKMERSGSWWRPWNYGDYIGEYWAVREAVSLMDVSTLGKAQITGPDALEFLERIYPTKVRTIKTGRARYVLMLNDRGYVFDDGLVAKEAENHYSLTFTSGGSSNAEMFMRDRAESWGMDVRFLNQTHGISAINVTGPLTKQLLDLVGATEIPNWLEHKHGEVAGIPVHIYRLSFTGELSFEIHVSAHRAVELWRALMAAGKPLGVRPHGLEALRTLRLEKGHIVVGPDAGMDGTPRRIHHEWAVKMSKDDFVGKGALERTNKTELDKMLVGMTMEAYLPLEGQPVFYKGAYAGSITSCAHSPVLGKTVMLVMLRFMDGDLPHEVDIDGHTATRTELPFYDKESARARA